MKRRSTLEALNLRRLTSTPLVRSAQVLMIAALVLLGGLSINAARADDSTDRVGIDIDRAVVVESPIEPSRAALSAVVAVGATKCSDITGGSGFLVGDGVIVTAAHLVDPDATMALVGVGSPVASGPARLAPSSDLAVATHDLIGVESLRLAAHDPEPGTQVALLGVERGGRVAVHAGVITSLGSAAAYGLEGSELLVVDTAVSPGHSGGPVIDANGDVVGVIAAGESRTATTLVTPVSELRALIGAAKSVGASGRTC